MAPDPDQSGADNPRVEYGIHELAPHGMVLKIDDGAIFEDVARVLQSTAFIAITLIPRKRRWSHSDFFRSNSDRLGSSNGTGAVMRGSGGEAIR